MWLSSLLNLPVRNYSPVFIYAMKIVYQVESATAVSLLGATFATEAMTIKSENAKIYCW